MAALTAASQRRIKPAGASIQRNFRVVNSDTIYFGAWVGLPGTSALTSSRGYAVPYQDESTLIWLGHAAGASPGDVETNMSVIGDTSESPVPEVVVDIGPLLFEQGTVTGVSAQTDVGDLVYASNDNDLTTTASYTPAVGRVVYWHSSTTADVLFYGMVGCDSSF